MTDTQQRAAAKYFAEYWAGKGYEKGESQKFWLSLLEDVFGVAHVSEYIDFEDQVHLDHASFIDGYIPETKVLIEQKSLDKSLTRPIRQSDGSLLSPFQQAKRYITELPLSRHPRWVIVCNFAEFHVYDMERPGGEPEKIFLKDLERDYYRLAFLVKKNDEHLAREMEISKQAGELIGAIHSLLLKQYGDCPTDADMQNLNALCVRLVFCLYAEDAGIFGSRLMFHDYLKQYTPQQTRVALERLFDVLAQKEADRPRFLREDDPTLAAFPYVNGGLFEKKIEIPPFSKEICDLLLNRVSAGFDWSEISPTIFGALFESTLNPETRRSGGMHYTSIENIHKVIDPLFLDGLRAEFRAIMEDTVIVRRNRRLEQFQEKLASLKFLDPAAGSGNFLTETYLCLRRMENEILEARYSTTHQIGDGQRTIDQSQLQIQMGDVFSPIKVSIGQFYGIEINDFAVAVAKTALWIAESQMMRRTEEIVHTALDFLPLKTQAHIVEGNALRMDWNDVVPAKELTYIMGNPPFVGARLMSPAQKDDLLTVFGAKWKNIGNLDYVCGWYKKAAEMMIDTRTRTALVSTNSVCQGENVANLWMPLMKSGVHIDFAHRTFRWDSEASIKAHVHCVIVGFSVAPSDKPKVIYSGEQSVIASHINGYLIDAEDMFVESRTKALFDAPEIKIGSQPIDDGNYLFSKEEMESFIRIEPSSKPLFRTWYGSKEFIDRNPRFCLFLRGCSPNTIRSMPQVIKRIENVRNFRLSSNRASTKKCAENPTEFGMTTLSDSDFIIIPKVSSEKRRYVPMGFLGPESLCSDLVFIIPNATLYHFGILTSNVHMAWMRTVCGRLKSDYRYSKDIVYNNFPWPSPTPEQKARIEQTAQAILDARALYPDASLADLYDDLTMPPELRTAHQENDKAVMRAYGMQKTGSDGKLHWLDESEVVADLMRRYKALTDDEKVPRAR